MKLVVVLTLALASAATAQAPVTLPTTPAAELRAGVLTVPYGAFVPLLSCDLHRICRVVLEPGEALADRPLLGDNGRWFVVHTEGGPADVVTVKATECGLRTNLMLLSTRRNYDIDLESSPCRGGGRYEPVRELRFTYDSPTEMMQESEVPVPLSLTERSALASNTAYRWKRRGRFPWAPERVANDAIHTYIQLPKAAQYAAAPVLYTVDAKGERTLVNYITEGDLYVADRVFDRAVLVIGEATLEIERRGE